MIKMSRPLKIVNIFIQCMLGAVNRNEEEKGARSQTSMQKEHSLDMLKIRKM